MYFRKSHGFTLIEILIVVAVLGVLTAIAVPQMQNAMVRSKIAAAQSNIHACAMALENYFLDNNDYPPSRYFCLAWGEQEARKYFELPWELTTPVAYLSNRPLDPFFTYTGASDEAPGQTIKYRHPGFGYFNGMPTEEGIWVPKAFPEDDGEYIFYNNASKKHPAKDSPVQYGLWSVGPVPALEVSLNSKHPVPSHTWYDPSNGIYSEGIIVRLDTGHHSP